MEDLSDHPHHEHDPPEKPWRLSEKGQALRAALVEHIGDPSEHPPTSTQAALMLGIMTACMRAHFDAKPLSHDDAQAAAALLSTAIEDQHGSHLEDIAEGHGIQPGSSREELRALWNRPRLHLNAREVTNFLGNYILTEEHPGFAPTMPRNHDTWEHRILHDEDTGHTVAFHFQTPPHLSPDNALARAQQRAAATVEMLDDAGLAYLRRPSVNALADDLPQRFAAEYLNSATHPHLIFERLHSTPDPQPGLSEEIELIHAGHMVHAFKRPKTHNQEDDYGT